MNIFSKVKASILEIEKRVPFIPDFSDVNNIGKIGLVSFWITVIYSFTRISDYEQFYSAFVDTVKSITPFIMLQLSFLIVFSKLIRKLSPFFAIIFIVFLDFITVYLVQSIVHGSYNFFFDNIKNSMLQFYISVGIVFIFLIYFDWREKNLDPANNLAKLTFLQSKMKPHFLFNTLTSVISLIKKDGDTARKMLLNLSELLRVSIKEENITTMYSLKEELDLCQKYLDIEKIRLGDRLITQFEIDNDILLAKVPRLFLQPLVENSILHGIQALEDGGIIKLSIYQKENFLQLKISNPIGRKNHDSNNTALTNIKQRLGIYYNHKAHFETQIDDGYYFVYIKIPLIYA